MWLYFFFIAIWTVTMQSYPEKSPFWCKMEQLFNFSHLTVDLINCLNLKTYRYWLIGIRSEFEAAHRITLKFRKLRIVQIHLCQWQRMEFKWIFQMNNELYSRTWSVCEWEIDSNECADHASSIWERSHSYARVNCSNWWKKNLTLNRNT